MNETHLKFLSQIDNKDLPYKGQCSLKWATSILPPPQLFDHCLKQQFNRCKLFVYAGNTGNSNLDVLAAILSWGGMKRDHARLLFNNLDLVLSLVDKLRKGHFETRQTAFEAIQENRANGNLPGLGIGYFTKLICFLSPTLKGYIMDQWAAKSINLLTGKNIVNITTGGWVNDDNAGNDYENFCKQIEELAKLLKCEGLEAEEKIFSIGGKRKGQWRNYLIANYQK